MPTWHNIMTGALALQSYEYNVTSVILLDLWLSFARYLPSLLGLVRPQVIASRRTRRFPCLTGRKTAGSCNALGKSFSCSGSFVGHVRTMLPAIGVLVTRGQPPEAFVQPRLDQLIGPHRSRLRAASPLRSDSSSLQLVGRHSTVLEPGNGADKMMFDRLGLVCAPTPFRLTSVRFQGFAGSQVGSVSDNMALVPRCVRSSKNVTNSWLDVVLIRIGQ